MLLLMYKRAKLTVWLLLTAGRHTSLSGSVKSPACPLFAGSALKNCVCLCCRLSLMLIRRASQRRTSPSHPTLFRRDAASRVSSLHKVSRLDSSSVERSPLHVGRGQILQPSSRMPDESAKILPLEGELTCQNHSAFPQNASCDSSCQRIICTLSLYHNDHERMQDLQRVARPVRLQNFER